MGGDQRQGEDGEQRAVFVAEQMRLQRPRAFRRGGRQEPFARRRAEIAVVGGEPRVDVRDLRADSRRLALGQAVEEGLEIDERAEAVGVLAAREQAGGAPCGLPLIERDSAGARRARDRCGRARQP